MASRRTKATLPNLVTIDYAYNNGNELATLTYTPTTAGSRPSVGDSPSVDGARPPPGRFACIEKDSNLGSIRTGEES